MKFLDAIQQIASTPHYSDCPLRGEQTGWRECPTCANKTTRRKVFACPHYREGVTIRDCEANARRGECIPVAPARVAVVLDPFVGSGTTCMVAAQLGRDSIGIDLNREYLDMAWEKRILPVLECVPPREAKEGQRSLFDGDAAP